MSRYVVTFKTIDDKDSFVGRYPFVDISELSAAHLAYYLDDDTLNIDAINPYCNRVELRQRQPHLWRPINTAYRVESGGAYDEYNVYYFESGFAVGQNDDWASGEVIGPWYIMTGYLGLIDAWDVSQGSGVTVTLQEKFDYTHFSYRVDDTDFDIDQYVSIYNTITGGKHQYFIPYDSGVDSFPTISGSLCTCFFHSGGTQYSTSGTTSGCELSNPPNLTSAWYNPLTCYTNWYGSECINGEWNWDSTQVPSSFAPFGHGDITTSIVAARNTPIGAITGYGQQSSPVGIAPQCNVLLGNNEDSYVAKESELGADIRIGAFMGNWSQTEADIAYATGTVLVRGPGNASNFNYTDMNSDANRIYNTVQIAPARYMGNETTIYTLTGSDITATGNYGMYAGYGRSKYAMFAAPANGIWSAHQNALWFTFWLKTNKPTQFKYIINKITEMGRVVK